MTNKVKCCEVSWKYNYEAKAHGMAVLLSFIENGKIFVTNGEYCNQVNYCPFCGKKANVQPEKETEETINAVNSLSE